MEALHLHEVQHDRRASVALDAITTSLQQHAREHRRPKALTAREALAALKFEALVVTVAAGNLAHGVELTEEDRERLSLACQRIDLITDEVLG